MARNLSFVDRPIRCSGRKFTPGSMCNLGLGQKDMRAIHPKLIWATISGFGRNEDYLGPYSDRPAFDIVAKSISGIMQALLMKERTGEGQFVDSAMLDNMLALNESMITLHSVSGQNPQQGVFKIYGHAVRTKKNGYIALNVPDNIIWSRLCEAMGHP